MRDRLIELLLNSDPLHERDLDDDLVDGEIEAIADHLIENGVIVPPCKVGDTVYNCLGKSYKVEKIVIQSGQKHIKFVLTNALTGQLIVDETDFGQIVFITLEEAEQELKGECHAEIH